MWAWVVVWSGLVGVVLAFCPNGCRCDDQGPSASCVGVGLTFFPILLNPGLRQLNIAHNLITSIVEGLIFFHQLEELDFSHNMLTSLGTGNLASQQKLVELRLAHNNLTTMVPGSLLGLRSLDLLDLSHNGLTDLPPGVLSDVPRLSVLLLAHNNLHALSQHSFRGLRALHVLDLCHNYFRSVPESAFDYLKNIKSLLLCHNRLIRIETNSFTSTTLSSLSLEANIIEVLSADAFQHSQELKHLNLNDNRLREVPVTPPSLESLVLSKNNITSIDSAAFNSHSRLLSLDISRCPRLAWFHPESFNNCISLQKLILTHNPSIRYLPEGFLSSLPRLNSVNLRGNSLQAVSSESLPLSSLRHLDLRDNALVCNCSLRWLVPVVAGVNRSLEAPDVKCAAPPKLKGLYLSRLQGSGQVCGWTGQVMAGVAVVSCCLLLLAALTLLMCRYRMRQKREKLGRGWPPGPLAPWPPDPHTAPTRHIMADDYLYHSYHTVRKVPVTEV